MAYGWESERIRLIPLEKETMASPLAEMLQDPEITEFIPDSIPLWSTATKEDWFDRAEERKDFKLAITLLDGTLIGHTAITRIKLRDGLGVTGSVIMKKYQSKGYGTEAAILRSWLGFNLIGLRMLISGYEEGNIASAEMQKKVGYQEWGTLPKASWNRGKFTNLVQTYLTKEFFEELHGNFAPKSIQNSPGTQPK